jgi:hypothetical protein
MRNERLGKNQKSAIERSRHNQVVLDPITADPTKLRDAVYRALSAMDELNQFITREKILAELEHSGFNLSQHLLVLGIPATRREELTPIDLARLVRFVRINSPKTITALAPILVEFLDTGDRTRAATSAGAL